MVTYALWNTEVDLTLPSIPSPETLSQMDEGTGNPEHGYFQTPHGKLHYRKYLPDGEIKAVCVWQHGINAHSGRYCKLGNADNDSEAKFTNTGLLARQMKKAGYALYAPDMLGHGFSEGKRFYIPNGQWEINRDGLASFAKFASGQHESIPFFLMGDSYGGCLTLHIARKWQDCPEDAPTNFKGITLNAPAIKGDVPSPAAVLFLKFLAAVAPERTPFFMPHPVSPDRIWKNEVVRAHFMSDEEKSMMLAGGGKPFRLGTAKGLLSALEAVREKVIPGFNIPFCVCHGTHDWGVPVTGTEFLLEHATTKEQDRGVRIIDGAFHDLLADPTMEETVDFHLKWMDSRLG